VAITTVHSVLGNVFHDRRLSNKCKRMKAAGACESLPVSRAEMERLRLMRKTDRGTEVGIVLEPGNKLEHGDVLLDDGKKFIVVEQTPEKVVSVRIKEKDPDKIARLSALVGHAIGNRHRPIAVDDDEEEDGGGSIAFPVMTDSELELFRKLLPAGKIELKIETRVFQPTEGAAHTHEH
jgi:urease accessory protein UreE